MDTVPGVAAVRKADVATERWGGCGTWWCSSGPGVSYMVRVGQCRAARSFSSGDRGAGNLGSGWNGTYERGDWTVSGTGDTSGSIVWGRTEVFFLK